MKPNSTLETTVKTQDDTHLPQKQSKSTLWVEPTRRELLVWSVPVVASISLPAHAQMSECTTPPVLRAITPAKCAGQNPQGEATLGIFSSAAVTLDIISITDDAVDPNTITYSATSGMVTDVTGIDVSWAGPSTDATTCLPQVNVTITVSYTCNNDPMTFTETFSLLDVLAVAVP